MPLLSGNSVASNMDCGYVRRPGPGLGNLLFPISRAIIGAELYGGELVYPTMRQIKIGPYLRVEPDKRTYGDILRVRNMHEWKVWFKAFGGRHINESQYEGLQENVVIEYHGLHNYFHDLVGHRLSLLNWLNACSKLPFDCDNIDVGIHIRLGDFAVANIGSSGSNTRIPIEWYLESLRESKKILKLDNPNVRVFTDADQSEATRLASLFGSNTQLDVSDNALHAILNLSKSKIIIASRSTFSMWAAFLGESQTLWDKSFALDEYFPIRQDLDLLL